MNVCRPTRRQCGNRFSNMCMYVCMVIKYTKWKKFSEESLNLRGVNRTRSLSRVKYHRERAREKLVKAEQGLFGRQLLDVWAHTVSSDTIVSVLSRYTVGMFTPRFAYTYFHTYYLRYNNIIWSLCEQSCVCRMSISQYVLYLNNVVTRMSALLLDKTLKKGIWNVLCWRKKNIHWKPLIDVTSNVVTSY